MRFLRLHVKVKADGKWQKENEAAEVEDVGDIGKIKESLNSMEYDFLRENIHLGRHVMLVGLAGSYAYGTDNENSDVDIRGVALNRKSDLIGLTEFEQYTDSRTDTVIYGFSKIVRLLLECNPNTMELLGLRPEHYLYLSDMGRELIENRTLFLSRRAVQSFGGYADAQLRRLQNALARDSYPQQEKEGHILSSIRNAMYEFRRRYGDFEEGQVRLYTDRAVNRELETEIFMDVNLRHYPLRDYKSMWMEMNNIVKDYEKLGKRNRKKDDNHLNKHAMHLIRLLMTGIDILEKGEICVYREKEHDLLLAVRNGEYQKEDGTFSSDFYDIVSMYEKRLAYAAAHTSLPEAPDMERVQEYVMSVNERVVRNEISGL